MKGRRASVGAELVPLVLILACLAGSLALIVSAHRRKGPKLPEKPAVSIAFAPGPKPAPTPKPAPAPVVVDEPEPPPLPTPPDPTPGVVAKVTSAEAAELLEASRADRKSAALEEARKSAEAESERWRRRESLVHAQLDSLDGKLRLVEKDIDAMALERDALEKERDARKAAIARGKSRPGQAILPHKGPNGTWRRPIVVECRNGMAILQPKGLEFGLFELESGFGPASNPFVAAVAREAIRIQGKATPDGEQAVPYIFFVVRPDGIRPYYEARGRLEPLGITFGYELADQEWEIDFPDLDDLATWDGSGSRKAAAEEFVASFQPGPATSGTPKAEDADVPSWPGARRAAGGKGGGDFAWPPKSRFLAGNDGKPAGGAGGVGPVGGGGGAGSGGDGLSPEVPSGYPEGLGGGPDEKPGLAGGDKPNPGQGSGRPGGGKPGGMGSGGLASAPRPGGGGKPGPKPGGGLGGTGDELVAQVGPAGGLGDSPIAENSGSGGGASKVRPSGLELPENPGSGGISLGMPQDDVPTMPAGGGGAAEPGDPKPQGQADPGTAFVWPAGGSGQKKDKPALPSMFDEGSVSAPAMAGPSGAEDDPGGGSSSQGKPTSNGSGGKVSGASSADAKAAGQASGMAGMGTPPPGMNAPQGLSLPMPPMGSPPPSLAGLPPIPPSVQLPKSRTSLPSLPDLGSKVVDRTFEVVVVCGPRGVIVQPGGYRVTADALRDRDGLFKRQIVGLVKGRRAADPKLTVEPRIRFLVQPGGFETYRAARSQFLLSGLDWPESFHVADPDPLAIMPSESW